MNYLHRLLLAKQNQKHLFNTQKQECPECGTDCDIHSTFQRQQLGMEALEMAANQQNLDSTNGVLLKNKTIVKVEAPSVHELKLTTLDGEVLFIISGVGGGVSVYKEK